MAKTRVLRLIAALLVAVNVMGVSTVHATTAGCGNWECWYAGNSFCEEKGCGILWLESDEVHYQNMHYKRVCVDNNNKTRTEYKKEKEYLGCC